MLELLSLIVLLAAVVWLFERADRKTR